MNTKAKESSTAAIGNGVAVSSGLRAAIYTRKSSTDDRSGSNRSTTAQERECRALAERCGLEVVEVYEEAIGTSASHLTNDDRPEYRRALSEMGVTFDVLIAWALDRITRKGVDEMAELFQRVTASGGRVLTNDFDSDAAEARIMGTLVSELARAEMEKMGERVRRGKSEQRSRGEYMGGQLPFGWVRDTEAEYGVKVDPQAAAIVVEMVDRLIGGAVLKEVCNWLNGSGHRTATGAFWTPTVLSRLVRSPHLIGHRRYNRTQIYCDAIGNPVQVVEPIISEAQFARVDKVLKARRRRPSDPEAPTKFRGKSHTSLLGGLIGCGDCGEKMKLQSLRKQGDAYYVCPVCAVRHSVRADLLEAHVSRCALGLVASLEPGSAITAEVANRMLSTFSPEEASRRTDIEDAIEVLNSRLGELRRAHFELGDVPKDEYDRMAANLTMQVNDLMIEVATLPETKPDLGILLDLCQASDDPDDIVGEGSAWVGLDHHRRRSIIRVLVDQIVVERRAKPSVDIVARTTIEFCREDNGVQLGQRPDKTRRFNTVAKVAV